MKKILLWMLAAILTLCGTAALMTSCSSNDDNPGGPDYSKYSESTRELISLVDKNAELKTLLEKAIAKGKEQNPDKKTNPAQSLSEYYDFVEWAAHSMPVSRKTSTGATGFISPCAPKTIAERLRF